MKGFTKLVPASLQKGNVIPGTNITIGDYIKSLDPLPGMDRYIAPTHDWKGDYVSPEMCKENNTWYKADKIEEYENCFLLMQGWLCVGYKMK